MPVKFFPLFFFLYFFFFNSLVRAAKSAWHAKRWPDRETVAGGVCFSAGDFVPYGPGQVQVRSGIKSITGITYWSELFSRLGSSVLGRGTRPDWYLQL